VPPAEAPSAKPAASPPAAAESAAAGAPAALAPAGGQPVARELIEVELTFKHDINEPTLRAEIEQTAQELKIPLSYFELANPDWQEGSSNAFGTWTLRIPTTESEAKQLLERLEARFGQTPVWSSSNKIGPQVAGKMRNTAIAALVASWFGIIVYVWIRFQNLVFGLAAVVALVHDVLVTVAALAASSWLAGFLGFLLIEDFKISLTIVAALLTIVGYSINDTIVIFDRLREIRGKSPDITPAMVNLSLNQTLSRTILTSFTVLLVVVVLYGFGGPGIHGFAFSLLVGVISGSYSTIYIASPFVLWLAGKSAEAAPKSVAA
jgi:SecD/SecF fusion protein